MPRPSYPLFDHLTRLDARSRACRTISTTTARWAIDFASVERALVRRTRAVLVVSPNNPTGSFVVAGELDASARAVRDRGIAIIADEVFADYALDARRRVDAGRARRASMCWRSRSAACRSRPGCRR